MNGSLMEELARRDVQLWTNDGRLMVRARRGALTPELRAELARSRGDLIAMLREQAAPRATQQVPSIASHPEDRCLPFPLTEVQRAYWVGRGDAFDLGNVSCHVYHEVDAKDLDVKR